MYSRIEKEKYFWIIFKVSLIITLLTLSGLFYLFPRFEHISYVINKPPRIEIYVSEIPVTRQTKNLPPARPKPPGEGAVIAVEEAEFPDEVALSEITGTPGEAAASEGLPVEISARPILEVYPEVSGSACKGIISLLLLIESSGQVSEIEVLKNTTNSDFCLQKVIQAARRSRWLPARVNSRPVNSWVVKDYKFNIK